MSKMLYSFIHMTTVGVNGLKSPPVDYAL